MTKTFTREQLEEMGLPWQPPSGGQIVSDRMVGKSRWSVRHELIFREADQPPGEAWLVHYSVGATEMQDERPWEYDDTIEATLVRSVEKLVTVWEPAEDGSG